MKKRIIAKCKQTGKIFIDYDNKSGSLISHLKKIGVKLPVFLNSAYKRRKYNKTSNWVELYFDIEIVKVEFLKCEYCDWKTLDVDNKSGAYKKHLKEKHNIKLENNIVDHDLVTCKICGNKYKTLHKHLLAKHNTTLLKYQELYGFNTQVFAKSTMNKFNKALAKGRNTMEKKGISYKSKKENDLYHTLKVHIPNLKQTDRSIIKNNEIDIISHKSKIAIEFNGLRYHSELFGKKDKYYHINKTKALNKQGYTLIHVFEDVHTKKYDILINKLLHIFNLNKNPKIHGRKCSIIEINDNVLINNFLNNNHIQGSTRYDLAIGAYYNDELVAVMCFDDKRYMKKQNHNEIELVRFCTHNSYIINGIANKLFKYFLTNYFKNYSSVVSFADITFTNIINKTVYNHMGFEITKILKPDYFYTKNYHKRISKYSYGKKALKKKFPKHYSQNLTEWEIMQKAGYDRIWDCGKIKYEYKKKED